VEYSDVSVHGAAISQTWYPVLEKPLYRLKHGSLHPQRLLSKSQSMKIMTKSHVATMGKSTTDTRNTADNRRTISPKVFKNNLLEDVNEMEIEMHHNAITKIVEKDNVGCILTTEDEDMEADTLGDINDNAYFASLLRPKKKFKNNTTTRNNFNIISSKIKGKRLSSEGFLGSSRLKNSATNQLMLKNQSILMPIKTTIKITDEDIQDDDKKSQEDNSIDDSSLNSKTTGGIQNILHTYKSSISANE